MRCWRGTEACKLIFLSALLSCELNSLAFCLLSSRLFSESKQKSEKFLLLWLEFCCSHYFENQSHKPQADSISKWKAALPIGPSRPAYGLNSLNPKMLQPLGLLGGMQWLSQITQTPEPSVAPGSGFLPPFLGHMEAAVKVKASV